MVEQIEPEAKQRMDKCIESMQYELAKVRTGRAHPALVEDLMVVYYGQQTPLKQIASIVVEDARMLAITPWEKNMVGPIDKAIRSAGLGLNPTVAGMHIRVPLPPLTEETRQNLVKSVRSIAETAKVAIRNVRRDANAQLKNLLKSKAISEDEQKHYEERVQKLTDKHGKEIDVYIAQKESELLTV